MSKLTHANRVSNASKLAFFQAVSHPHGQTGGGLQVPVLQVGGGVTGLGQIDGADHRKVGYMTPELLACLEAPPMADTPPRLCWRIPTRATFHARSWCASAWRSSATTGPNFDFAAVPFWA